MKTLIPTIRLSKRVSPPAVFFTAIRHAGRCLVLCLLMVPALVMAQTVSAEASGGTAKPLRVVASFSILGDMVQVVGGPDIRLDVLVGPMQDGHGFEPSPRDARVLGAAQVLVINGLGFETWLPRLQEASGFAGLEVVASQGVHARMLNDGQEPDPHAWQDLRNGVQYVRNIAAGLAKADPAHASAYAARAQAYVQQLQQEDAQWRSALSAIPPSHRVLATSHDAFGYLGAAYDIRILSLVGISSQAEPSAKDMAALLQEIRTGHVRALFLEQGSMSAALKQIASEAGVSIGGTLYADTLSAKGGQAPSYLAMFRWNTQQLLTAFSEPAK